MLKRGEGIEKIVHFLLKCLGYEEHYKTVQRVNKNIRDKIHSKESKLKNFEKPWVLGLSKDFLMGFLNVGSKVTYD